MAKDFYWFDASTFWGNPVRLPENIEEILQESVKDVSEAAGFQAILHLTENQAAAMEAAVKKQNTRGSTYQIKFWQDTPGHAQDFFQPSRETIQKHYIGDKRVPARK